MIPVPREPSSGDRISATFMREIVRYVRSLRILNSPDVHVDHGPNGTTLGLRKDRAKVAPAPLYPFAVRWSTADGETGTDGKPSGAYVVYLPDGSLECEDNSLMAAWSNYLGDLEPAVADDWYLVPGDALETGILYLAVTVPVPDPDDPDADPGDYSVEFTQTTDGNLVNVPVADLTVTAATSTAPATHAARQLWVGSVILFDGVTGGGGGETPGDADVTDDQQSIETTEINGATCHQLHNFDKVWGDDRPEGDEPVQFTFAQGKSANDYYNGDENQLVPRLTGERSYEDGKEAGDFLWRGSDVDTEKKELHYSTPVVLLPPFVGGDANIESGGNDSSVEVINTYGDGTPQFRLNAFDQDVEDNVEVVGEIGDGSDEAGIAYFDTPCAANSVINSFDSDSETPDGDNGCDIVVRAKDGTNKKVDYANLKIKLPPFQPGDANRPSTVAPNSSVEWKNVDDDADKSHFQLHDFDSPTRAEKTITLVPGDTVALFPDDDLGSLLWRKVNGDDSAELSYAQLKIALPEYPEFDPEDPDMAEKIVEVIENWWDPEDDTGAKDELLEECDGRYWKTGGDSDTCNAESASIGGESGAGGLTLTGSFNQTGDPGFSTDSVVDCAGVNAHSADVGCGSVTIGTTTLSEADLQALLALIHNS